MSTLSSQSILYSSTRHTPCTEKPNQLCAKQFGKQIALSRLSIGDGANPKSARHLRARRSINRDKFQNKIK